MNLTTKERMRFNALKAMHTLMIMMNDETAYYSHWIYIIPDCATDEDLIDIATDEDEDTFREAVSCFNRCVKRYACVSGYCIPTVIGESSYKAYGIETDEPVSESED